MRMCLAFTLLDIVELVTWCSLCVLVLDSSVLGLPPIFPMNSFQRWTRLGCVDRCKGVASQGQGYQDDHPGGACSENEEGSKQLDGFRNNQTRRLVSCHRRRLLRMSYLSLPLFVRVLRRPFSLGGEMGVSLRCRETWGKSRLINTELIKRIALRDCTPAIVWDSWRRKLVLLNDSACKGLDHFPHRIIHNDFAQECTPAQRVRCVIWSYVHVNVHTMFEGGF